MTTIGVQYRTTAALLRDVASQLTHGGLFLQRDMKLPQFSAVTVELTAPDGEVFSLEGEVVQIVPGAATAIQLGPGAQQALAALRAFAAGLSGDGEAPADDPTLLDVDEQAATAVEEAEPLRADQLSLQAQIDGMTVAELRHAALHGPKDMRFLLARHLNKTLHSFVLKNPAIQVDEVEQIARLTSLNPNALHEIAVHREWSRSANVVRALVRNPKTPMPDALRMVDKLPLSECQAMMKSGALRMPILNAVKRRVRDG